MEIARLHWEQWLQNQVLKEKHVFRIRGDSLFEVGCRRYFYAPISPYHKARTLARARKADKERGKSRSWSNPNASVCFIKSELTHFTALIWFLSIVLLWKPLGYPEGFGLISYPYIQIAHKTKYPRGSHYLCAWFIALQNNCSRYAHLRITSWTS